uniref:CSON014439 protein n=1 Tax=Culicoides sonorensis TaxID=179676 RepID=A0A336JZR8_CULSO
MSSIIKLCSSLSSRYNPRLIVSRFTVQPRLCSSVKPSSGPSSSSDHDLKASHKVDNFERKILVWTGKYKSVDEVPKMVSQDTMERARNRMRIKIANYMMAATVVGCLIMVYSGKKAAERGESVSKQNLDWHKSYQAKADKTEKDYASKFEHMAREGAEAAKAN